MDGRHWSQAQLDAVLAHEGEHARRRDPLVQWLALLNGRFLVSSAGLVAGTAAFRLAEEACDDAVLAGGHIRRII